MIILASEILIESKILLNDASGILYTDTILIPLLQKAYRELQQKMRKAGMTVTREATSSTNNPITIPANLGSLVEGDGYYPNDLILPIEIHERQEGVSEWIELQKRAWSPLVNASVNQVSGGSWTWREEEIKLSPAGYERQLVIRYHKELPRITDVNSVIQIKGADTFLASRCSAIAALVIGENESRARVLDLDARAGWKDLKSTRVKSAQSTPVRREVNRYRAVQ